MTDTKIIDLEECVYKNFADINLTECKSCEGYDYNCDCYYPLKEHLKLEEGVYKRK